VVKALATSRKVAGSRPDEVNEIVNLPNPFGRTKALGFTHRRTKMSTRSRKIIFFESKLRPVRMATCEPIV
jgi:hypothetical protein